MKTAIKSTILALIALVVLIIVFPTAVFADNGNFEPRLSAPEKSNSYYNRSLNVYAQCGYGMPNCTAYAYGRIYEITGEEPLIKRGSADSWWKINKSNDYYEYGQEPRLGAIACWSNHVAVVEEIDGSTVTVSQSHWRGTYFDTTTFTSGSSRFGQKFYGYIYACDITADEEDTAVMYKMEVSPYETAETQLANQFSHKDLFGESDTDLLIGSRMLANALI